MKTYLPNPREVERQWLLIDATDLTLGRMAAKVAAMLRGKHKPTYTPNVDMGDHVIIINADKVRITANKLETKTKYSHTGHPGGFKEIPFGRLMQKNPAETVRRVIKGMIPHTALGRHMIKKLKVYAGSEHPHQAQLPVDVTEQLRQ